MLGEDKKNLPENKGLNNASLVQLPSKGIPDNPITDKIGAMTLEEQNNFGKELSAKSDLKESDYVFSSGGIFDK